MFLFQYAYQSVKKRRRICCAVWVRLVSLWCAAGGYFRRHSFLRCALYAGLKTGLSIRTDDPSQLGSELVCSAIAVLADYPPPCVIISMDTAVSITALDNRGALRGGAILPGVKIGVEALCARTAQLPQIDLSAPACGVLGTNSSASMQAGAIFGTASMLDGMIDRFAQALGGTPTCVASGELAPVILPHCLHKIYYRENLVLDGLYRLYQKNTK